MKRLKWLLIAPVVICLFLSGCFVKVQQSESQARQAPTETIVDSAGVGKVTIRRPVPLQSSETHVATEPSSEEALLPSEPPRDKAVDYADGEQIGLDSEWEFADYSVINSGAATLFKASSNRKNIIVGVNAGHGTSGVGSKKTYCHPDKTPKVTDGTTAEGAIKAIAVSSGMDFRDGTSEASVNLRVAKLLKDLLLEKGYDVLMIRTGSDVQLDNVARTVICNNIADCHIAIHFDGDGLSYDKGCFYMSVPDGIKNMYPVSTIWQENDRLGEALVSGLESCGLKIMGSGSVEMDLTQTSYSKVPSVDIELGNQSSDHSETYLMQLASGLSDGVDKFFLKQESSSFIIELLH